MQGKLKTFRTGSQNAKVLAYLQTGHNITSKQIKFDGGFVAEYSLEVEDD